MLREMFLAMLFTSEGSGKSEMTTCVCAGLARRRREEGETRLACAFERCD